MATSALVLMSLLSNHNVMTNMFDLEYLKTQEKNRLQQFKKEQRARKTSQIREYKAMMFSNKTPKMHNLNNFKYYLNYNIMKDNKR
jgi:hypothetical protein